MGRKTTGTDRAGMNTVVGKDSELDGHFVVDDGIRIDGTLRGSIEASGLLVVGPTGIVCADPIRVKNAVIAGRVEGNVQAEGEVRLDATATVIGNISGSVLIVTEGATLQGRCDVGDVGELSTTTPGVRRAAEG